MQVDSTPPVLLQTTPSFKSIIKIKKEKNIYIKINMRSVKELNEKTKCEIKMDILDSESTSLL